MHMTTLKPIALAAMILLISHGGQVAHHLPIANALGEVRLTHEGS